GRNRYGAIKDPAAYLAQGDVSALRFKEGDEHASTAPDARRQPKSTRFPMHRIREAMRDPFFGSQMGGFRKLVQADETFVGRRTSRAGEVRQRGYAEKEPIVTLVDVAKIRVIRSVIISWKSEFGCCSHDLSQ